MRTARDLLRASFNRWRELACLKGNLEDYALYTVAKVVSFGAGLGLGYWLWA